MNVYDLHDDMVSEFFASARARYRIFRKKQGALGAVEEDPVLSRWFFANVFREDDVTTQFIRETLREPMREKPEVIQWMMLARLINRIEPLEKLMDAGLMDNWDWSLAGDVIKDVSPVVGGAYRVRTPGGMTKAEGVLKIASDNWNAVWNLGTRIIPRQDTMQSTWESLSQMPYLARVVSYEIVKDLRHTYMLEHAKDRNSWAAPTAGLAVGMSWLVARRGDFFHKEVGKKAMKGINGSLLRLRSLTQYDELWPSDWPKWEMADVAHWLTQYGAYASAKHNGKMLHRRYPVGTKSK